MTNGGPDWVSQGIQKRMQVAMVIARQVAKGLVTGRDAGEEEWKSSGEKGERRRGKGVKVKEKSKA